MEVRRKIPFFKVNRNKAPISKGIEMTDNAFDMLKDYAKDDKQEAAIYDAVEKAKNIYQVIDENKIRQDEQVKIVERNIKNILDALENINGDNYNLQKYLNEVEIKSFTKNDYINSNMKCIIDDLLSVGISKTRCKIDIKPILMELIKKKL